MKTAIVILNYNTSGYLRRFLPGMLQSIEGQDAGIVVADNASADDSVAVMEKEFPGVKLLKLDRNYGFTGGYNRALAMVDAEYYVLMNSDIEVPAGWLEPLVGWMDSHPGCGACGPKLLDWNHRERFEYAGAAGGYIDSLGYPFCRGRIMQKIENDKGQHDSPEDVLWCSGACLMVRSSVWRGMGGLDDRFFAHMEEIDLCWRMQLSGWTVSCVPDSRVYHIGGGTLPNENPFKIRLNFRNNLLLLENNLPATFYAMMAGRDGAACCRASLELRARHKARRRIIVRMMLDLLSALVFLIKGKRSFSKAVIQAHGEYRKLKAPGSIPDNPGLPHGLKKGWIVPRGLL